MNLETVIGPSTLEVVAAYLDMLTSRAWLGRLGQVGHAFDRPAGKDALLTMSVFYLTLPSNTITGGVLV